jgi:hypothetical protein
VTSRPDRPARGRRTSMPSRPGAWSQPAVVTRRLQAAAERAREVMASPGAVARYHPFCSDNPVAAWPGVGAQDTIHYLSGLVLHRRFTAWEEGHAYELEIGNAGWPVSHVRWELAAAGAEESEITISIWPGAFVGCPSIVRWALHRCYLLPLLRRYLDALLRGVNYYVTTGRDVEPNQFGRVRLFS